MKETAIEVTVFRKGMTLQEMNEFAQSIKAQYDQGYAHHEGFDAGDLAVIVMKREFDVVQELAPDFQSAAQTLDMALSQANQTIEYLRNEIAVLRNGNASMISEADAKTLANVAYNRGRSIGELHCQLDFEHWWTEFRKENGFSNHQPKPYHPESIDQVFEKLKALADMHMLWVDLSKDASHDSNMGAFNTAVHTEFMFAMWAPFHNESESKIKEGITRLDYLYWMATQIYAQLTTVKDAPKPKADPITADEVLPRINALAIQFFGWAREWMQGVVSEQDKSIQLFHTLVADEYELQLDIEATNKGLRLFEITRMQYLEKVAQAVADALNK